MDIFLTIIGIVFTAFCTWVAVTKTTGRQIQDLEDRLEVTTEGRFLAIEWLISKTYDMQRKDVSDDPQRVSLSNFFYEQFVEDIGEDVKGKFTDRRKDYLEFFQRVEEKEDKG